MLLLEPNLEDIIIQEDHIEGNTIIFIEVPVDATSGNLCYQCKKEGPL